MSAVMPVHGAAEPAVAASAVAVAAAPLAAPAGAAVPPPVKVAVAREPAWKPFMRKYGLPLMLGIVVLALWEWAVAAFAVPKFVLPAPSLIFQTFLKDAPYLFHAWQYTAMISIGAFACALASGFLFGIVITQSKTLENMLWPYVVILHATPNFALAPLIIIWVGFGNTWLALLINAWLVAFFPVLSNTVVGLKSADHGLRNIFGLYEASRWKRFRYLQLPSALPYIMAGVRISASLAVIGAIVAEFLASSGTATGLAWAILESGTQLNIPRMFAAVMVLSAYGLAIFYLTNWVQHRLLAHWHESESHQEN